jgi:hypothetical protein
MIIQWNCALQRRLLLKRGLYVGSESIDVVKRFGFVKKY